MELTELDSEDVIVGEAAEEAVELLEVADDPTAVMFEPVVERLTDAVDLPVAVTP